LANGLFLQQGFAVEPAFLSGLQQHFGAAPETLDFLGNPAGARDAINEWASDRTRGIIPRLLGEVSPETRLALANAVYLDADWRHPFEKSDTFHGPFHTNRARTSVEFMHETEALRYGAGRGYRAVDLPYRASTLSLLVVLPRGKSIGALQRQLGAQGLTRVARHLSPRPVILSLPRFHLNTQTSLNSALESLGMTAAFSDAADFSRVTTSTPLKIGFVQHAADFTVDEEGTVAAAATVVGIELSSGLARPLNAVTFNANRPFLFFLRDRRTGAVLFAGRLTNPNPS
jgi:serpin B